MPIVDGMASTRTIRAHETSNSFLKLSPRAQLNGRVPIIAVSASLVEKERQKYIDTGFDGWILKPISFARLNDLMKGIVDRETREQALYQPGQWEKGGWFHITEQLDSPPATLEPSEAPPATDGESHDDATTQTQAESGQPEIKRTPSDGSAQVFTTPMSTPNIELTEPEEDQSPK